MVMPAVMVVHAPLLTVYPCRFEEKLFCFIGVDVVDVAIVDGIIDSPL